MPDSRQPAAAEFGEKTDEGRTHGRRLTEDAADHYAVDQCDAGTHPVRRSENLASLLKPRLRLIPHAYQRRERVGRTETRARRRLALEPQCIRPDKSPATMH